MARTLLNVSEIVKTIGGQTGYEFTTEVLEGEYNITNNTSPVTTNLYCKGLNGFYYTDWHSPYATISYDNVEKQRNNIVNTSTSKILICSFTEDIEHDSDGTKKINIKTIYNNGGASAYYIPQNYTFTANNVELTTIPRNSKFTATSMNYNFSDGNIAISTTKYIPNAIDTLTIKYNNTTLFSSSDYTSNTQLSPISSAVTSIANANVNNKTCTLVATLKTYVNSEQVGTTQTMNITASFNNDLVIDGITCIDTNSNTTALTNDNTIIVNGLSNVQCTLNYTSQFAGTLDSIIVDNVNYTNNPFTLNAYNSNVINVIVKSHRDFSYNYVKTIATNKYVNYSKPTLNATIGRTSQTGDTITANLAGTWYKGNIGATTNTLSAYYRSKLYTSTTYGSWNSITLTTDNDGNYTGTFTANGFTYTNQYDVQIAICDSYYNNKQLYQTFRIMKSTPIYDVGENDVHFRCDVEIDNNLVVTGTLNGTTTGNAPINHSSNTTTYGVGTTSNYGHNKIINDTNSNTYVDGEVLSAYQGYLLNEKLKIQDFTSSCTFPNSTKNAGVAYKIGRLAVIEMSVTPTSTSSWGILFNVPQELYPMPLYDNGVPISMSDGIYWVYGENAVNGAGNVKSTMTSGNMQNIVLIYLTAS